MAKDEPHMTPMGTDQATRPVRDVADFHLRWPEFRTDILALVAKGELTPAQRETLRWLVQMADRIGERDLT
ncbi:MAG: hypothetical protein ACRCUE_04105 [Bosea sp. (in: a-proteobacteria)]